MAKARSRKKQKKLLDKLLEVIARDLLPDRFGRYEPRAVKRRPKPYPLLNRPRRQIRDPPPQSPLENSPQKTRG